MSVPASTPVTLSAYILPSAFLRRLRIPFSITARSWACPSKGVSFIRSYEIERDGEIICEAVSSWALVSVSDKKLIRVDDVDTGNYYTDEPIKTEHPMRIRIPSALPMTLVGEYTVRYSDTDINGHVNNTNYAPWLVFRDATGVVLAAGCLCTQKFSFFVWIIINNTTNFFFAICGINNIP